MILLLGLHCLDKAPDVPVLVGLLTDLPLDTFLHPAHSLAHIPYFLVDPLFASAHNLMYPPVEIYLRESQCHLSPYPLLHKL